MVDQKKLELLNADSAKERLDNLAKLKALSGVSLKTKNDIEDTNNHIHTKYSFSPYSPSAAVYFAAESGLCTAGIVDHDSIAGAHEFIEAGKIVGIATTVGCEVRVNFTGTPLEGKRLNNPDEVNSAYIALHGVPHNMIDKLDAVLSEIRQKRNDRNKKQIALINKRLPMDVRLDFYRDIVPISYSNWGGSITERHILMALSNKLVTYCGKGKKVAGLLEDCFNISLNAKAVSIISDETAGDYEYRLLNVLKSELVPMFFIQGGEDQFPVKYMVDVAREIGAVPSYCYLGDVGESPTGDKKAQKFEDEILDSLFPVLKDLGFVGLAYMPSRNTMDQLKRVMSAADEFGFIQISGEDINQPSQPFVCEKLREPLFEHLGDSTWALVGHEYMAEQNINDTIYGTNAERIYPDISARMKAYADKGRKVAEGEYK